MPSLALAKNLQGELLQLERGAYALCTGKPAVDHNGMGTIQRP